MDVRIGNLYILVTSGIFCFIAQVQATPITSLREKCPAMYQWQKLHPHAIQNIDTHKLDTGAKNPELQRKLVNAYVDEQKAIFNAFKDIGDGIKTSPAIDHWHAVNKSNLKLIKSIIKNYSFPTPNLVGKDGTFAAFMLVQHADTDPMFQASVLPKVRKLFKKHVIPGEMVAYFTDRIQVAQHKKQLYGTQFYMKDHALIPRPVISPMKLDERRKSLNLPSMEAYACYISYRSGQDVKLPSKFDHN